jgi:hypothetical protein
MVGVINPANGTSIDKQKRAAMNASFQLLPGEAWPAESVSGTEIPAISSSQIPSSSPSPAISSQIASSIIPSSSPLLASSTSHDHLSRDAIIAVTIGTLTAILLVAAGLLSFIRLSKTKKSNIGKGTEPENHDAPNTTRYLPCSDDTPENPNLNLPMGQAGSQIWYPAIGPSSTQETITSESNFGNMVGQAVPYSPRSEKSPTSAPTGHPAFGLRSIQGTTVELPGEEPNVEYQG